MYERVAELDVFLWGHHVGSLAPESGSFFVFQYDPEFVRSGLQIAPFMLPLQTGLSHTATMGVPKKEYEVYRKALACGIEMSECRLFELDGVKHFMTKRFDRDGNRRHHGRRPSSRRGALRHRHGEAGAQGD